MTATITVPAGLILPYQRVWLKAVQRELARGKTEREAILQVNHDLGIHDGLHDRLK